MLPEFEGDKFQLGRLFSGYDINELNLTREFKPRPRAFLIFADLDGTFTPIDLHGWQDFVSIVKETIAREKVCIKFIPVSGRPAGYVLRVVHSIRDILKGDNIDKVCEFGAAEQGAVIVDSSRSYGPLVTIKAENCGLKPKIAQILQKNKYSAIISDEPDKMYTCSIHIKNESKEHMTNEQQRAVYFSVKDDVEAKFGKNTLNLSMAHNCMEVMTNDVSKARAIDILVRHYAREYNIVGLCYCGDAENDKIAMSHVSKLAEIPGINAHNFTPGNAQEAISSRKIENWKYKNVWAHEHYVEKAEPDLFIGISCLIRQAMDQKRLCGRGVEFFRTRDDHCPKHLYDLRHPFWGPKCKTLHKTLSYNEC